MSDLDADLVHVGAEIARADQKAALLAGLAGAGLAVVATAVKDYQMPLAAQIVGGAGVAAFIAAILVLLQVVLPDTGGTAPSGWPRWATCTPEQVLAELGEDRRAERLCGMARLAHRKMHGIRTAVRLLRGGIVLLTFGALGALILTLA
ncbi:Pycsar system effector family protein [Streptomyces sp. NPDC018584]|uniref:Pycsar system effector family protein n=1 Tax=unclassified Streptomyces TaxID=2593676 RepID=UPI0037BA3B14